VLEFILIYVIFIFIVLVAYYYSSLIMSKEQYTRDELKGVIKFFPVFLGKISEKYSFIMFFATMIVSSLIGMFIPAVSYHWFANSAILFGAVFAGLPVLKKNFEASRVTESQSYSDTAQNFILKYNESLIFGFGIGAGSILISNWGSSKEISFIWFILNLVIIIVLLTMTIKKIFE
jgi:hypothetical protein